MAQSVTERPPAQRETPELPPALAVSSLKPKALPNWGLKAAMAITGTFGALFLALHLFGNLKVFSGADSFNAYALGLRTFGYPILPHGCLIWSLRALLVIAVLIHVSAAVILWLRSRKARGRFKAKRNNGIRSWNATLAPVTGVAIFCFVIFHLADLTWGAKPFAASGFQHITGTTAHAYENLVASFDRPLAAAVYIGMMILIAIHVGHGISTVVTDLGVMGRRWRAAGVIIAGLFAVSILAGNAAIALFVQLGVIS